MVEREIAGIVLAGGKGTRLYDVTKGLIPKGLVTIDKDNKITGIDYISTLFKNANFDEVFITTNNLEAYKPFSDKYNFTLVKQSEKGTSGAIEDIFHIYGDDRDYLVISVDTLLSSQDFNKLINDHKAGTMSWGVSELVHEEMNPYFGLLINRNNSIIGDVKLNWWKNWETKDSEQFVKGAIQIINPKIYLDNLKKFKKLCRKNYPIDIYWDVFPLIEEVNRRRVLRGKNSILQAVIFENPIIDYGTPLRLELTREIFREINEK